MKVYAVIITFNPEIFLLEKEYLSVVSQVGHIVYVDNCSRNKESIYNWSKDKRNASFIWLDENEGLGTAQNVGIKLALERDASHVIIFDQDTVVNMDFVKSLLETEKKAISDGVNVGMIGPVYKSHDDDFPYPVWSLENDKLIKIPQDDIDDYREVTHIIASGSLIRREVFVSVGLMREDLFLGYIDFEYCFRVAQHGFKIIVTNNACMRHQMGDRQIIIHGRKIGLYSPFRRYFDCRNTILIQNDKVFPKVIRRYYLKLIIGKFFVSILYGPQRWKQLIYCIRGFYDGICGKTGKCNLS